MKIAILFITCMVFLDLSSKTCGVSTNKGNSNVDANATANNRLNVRNNARVHGNTNIPSNLQLNEVNRNVNAHASSSSTVNVNSQAAAPAHSCLRGEDNCHVNGHGNGKTIANNRVEPPEEQFDIQPGHRVFVQLQGDIAFVGHVGLMEWHPIPVWVFRPKDPTVPNDIPERVYIRSPRSEGLVGGLALLHNNTDHSVKRNRCFVVIENNVILTAPLHSKIPSINNFRQTRVYIRIPTERNVVFTGILQTERGVVPHWVH